MIRSGKSRRKKAYTLIELLMASFISLGVTIPIFQTFIYITRSQMTNFNIVDQRRRASIVMQTLMQDIRYNNMGAYNQSFWQKVTGGATTAPKMTLWLLNSTVGERVRWTYDRTTQHWQRRAETINNAGVAVVSRTDDFFIKFGDVYVEEVTGKALVASSVVDNIIGIRVVARVFLTMRPNHTLVQEVDANGDGKYTDDKVGAAPALKLGHTNRGDNPGWQHIYNVTTSFRNV